MGKPLKVGFLLLNPVWEPLGFSVRPRMLMIHLAQLGVEVHLFSAFKPDPTLGHGIHYHQLAVPPIPPAFSTIAYRITRSAFKMKPLFKNFFANESTLGTMIKRLASSLHPILKQHSWDVLQGEQDLAGAALLEARPSTKVPVVTDLLDLWADEEVMAGRIDAGGPAFHALQKMTGQVLTGSDLILVGNEEVSAYVVKMYRVDPAKVLISNNAGELRQERRTKTDDVPRVIYAGNFEVYSYVDLFAQCLPFLKKLVPGVEPLIVGKGPEERRLRRLLAGFGSDFASYLKKSINREDLFKLSLIPGCV